VSKGATVEVMPEIPNAPDADSKKNKKKVQQALRSQRATPPAVKEETVNEVAPPGKKYERMVKHIKKNYPKEKEGIAYATAWKHKNKNK